MTLTLNNLLKLPIIGPALRNTSLPSRTCPADRWHFTKCPSCQCNGHSNCINGTCMSCHNQTMGSNCEKCISGYWGSPLNRGKCQLCQCNDQAKECHPETGKCYCNTKGYIGDHCEKCDLINHYYADPTRNGSCYCKLVVYLYFFYDDRKWPVFFCDTMECITDPVYVSLRHKERPGYLQSG